MTPAVLLAAAPFGAWAAICLADYCLAPVPIRILNTPDPAHLVEVRADMARLGRPSIRAYRSGEGWAAIEGSHRTTLAAETGCGIEIIEIDPSEIISNHDVVSIETGEEFEPRAASELMRNLGEPVFVRFRRWKIAVRKLPRARGKTVFYPWPYNTTDCV